jgi:uncharacterized membrane protein required for colicin V production
MDFSNLQNFDYFILVIVALSVYGGWKNGLLRSFIAFFAWIGSIVIVVDSYDYLFNLLEGFIHSKFISAFAASIGFYIVLVILFNRLGERVSKATAKFGGSKTDQITGALFGGLIGGIIACTIFWGCYMSLYTLNDQKFPKWFSQAKSYKLLKLGSDSLMGIAFSEEERSKLLNMFKKKGNKLEEELKRSYEKKTKDDSSDNTSESSE